MARIKDVLKKGLDMFLVTCYSVSSNKKGGKDKFHLKVEPIISESGEKKQVLFMRKSILKSWENLKKS